MNLIPVTEPFEIINLLCRINSEELADRIDEIVIANTPDPELLDERPEYRHLDRSYPKSLGRLEKLKEQLIDIIKADIILSKRSYASLNLSKYEWRLSFLIREVLRWGKEQYKKNEDSNGDWVLHSNDTGLLCDYKMTKESIKAIEIAIEGNIYVKLKSISKSDYDSLISLFFSLDYVTIDNLHILKSLMIEFRGLMFVFKCGSTTLNDETRLRKSYDNILMFLNCLSDVGMGKILCVSLNNYLKDNEPYIYEVVRHHTILDL